jgi:hypothetical protein
VVKNKVAPPTSTGSRRSSGATRPTSRDRDIRSGDSLKNPNHWKFDTDQFFFKTAARMAGG